VAGAIEQAKAFAGDGDVSVTAGDVGGQALETGLVDELDLSVAPVVFGGGKRFFGSFDQEQLMLENPAIVEGDRVLHLRYAVRRR
jgi:dihydrofolate reductase